uniref:Uncharacterized protein n=1 Tax=Mycena chlorophos TaxID=658473 RepID=A0ABQ0LAA1_MYCCL|nr:predicted protein [Mycena chlorophos]
MLDTLTWAKTSLETQPRPSNSIPLLPLYLGNGGRKVPDKLEILKTLLEQYEAEVLRRGLIHGAHLCATSDGPRTREIEMPDEEDVEMEEAEL